MYQKIGFVLYIRYYFGHFYGGNVEDYSKKAFKITSVSANMRTEHLTLTPPPKSLKLYCYISQLSYNVVTA